MPRGRPHGGLAGHPALDDNRPKGVMTAYAFFVQTCREEYKRKFPDEVVVFADFQKKCADRWKTMSEKEKRRFSVMAEEDKKRYAYEMAHYVPPSMQLGRPGSNLSHHHHNMAGSSSPSGSHAASSSGMHNQYPTPATLSYGYDAYEQQRGQISERGMGRGGGRGRRRKKRMKDPNAPKRCMSAFFWYSQDARPKVRAANPDFGVGDIAKELGREWGEVSPETKAKYERLAEKDRARYDVAKREYAMQKKDASAGLMSTLAANAHAQAAAVQMAASMAAAAQMAAVAGAASSGMGSAGRAAALGLTNDDEDELLEEDDELIEEDEEAVFEEESD